MSMLSALATAKPAGRVASTLTSDPSKSNIYLDSEIETTAEDDIGVWPIFGARRETS
jgi:hypothetical protein